MGSEFAAHQFGGNLQSCLLNLWDALVSLQSQLGGPVKFGKFVSLKILIFCVRPLPSFVLLT